MPCLRPASRAALLAVAMLSAALPALAAEAVAARPAASAASGPVTGGQPPGPVTADVRERLFAVGRAALVQVRTLLKGPDSQSSVGSGFVVSASGHLITNYHVVSQYALQPAQYRLVFVSPDGRQGALELQGVDVVHDVALLRAADPALLADARPLAFRPADEPLARGERLQSLGNPLDVGFAVVEGAYNGLVERSFLPTIFFGGSLSPGMSGGPTLDAQARVIGVNVATRRDGEQVSFLVPAAYAAALFERARDAAPIVQPMHDEIARQLTAHQQALVERFVALPWRDSGNAYYRIPLPTETFMRCWGQSTSPETRGLRFERSDCAMDSRIFVAGGLLVGYLTTRHEAYDGRHLGTLRFLERYSASFKNEFFGSSDRQRTASHCHEDQVDRGGLPMRAVLCLRAYKKFGGLYDASLLVATLDGTEVGVLGRLDAYGVSFDNALRLAGHYLEGYARKAPAP